ARACPAPHGPGDPTCAPADHSAGSPEECLHPCAGGPSAKRPPPPGSAALPAPQKPLPQTFRTQQANSHISPESASPLPSIPQPATADDSGFQANSNGRMIFVDRPRCPPYPLSSCTFLHCNARRCPTKHPIKEESMTTVAEIIKNMEGKFNPAAAAGLDLV